MDKWIEIIFEAEDMWRNSVEAKIAAIRGYDTDVYCRERDLFKARRILDMYGDEYFRKFVDRCPHIKNYLDDYAYAPCERGDGNCNMICIFYQNGGCTNATK